MYILNLMYDFIILVKLLNYGLVWQFVITR